MGGFWGQNRGRGGAILTPMNSFLLFGVLTSVLILVKIDQEMRPWECSQTDRQTDRHTDANRFYNLSHAICYSYGTDNYFISQYLRLYTLVGILLWRYSNLWSFGYVSAARVADFRDEYFDFPCKYQCPQQQFQFANLDSRHSKFNVS